VFYLFSSSPTISSNIEQVKSIKKQESRVVAGKPHDAACLPSDKNNKFYLPEVENKTNTKSLSVRLPERQNAQMSKITNDGLTRSGT